MSVMQSTVGRVAAEEAAAKAAPDDGWKPGGAPLVDEDPFADSFAAAGDEMRRVSLIEDSPLGVRPADVSRETLPSIGHIVVYHLREGDSRNRRTKFPAIVMDADPETGTLKLWVIVDDGDTWMQDSVPARAAPEVGWELVKPHEITWVPPGVMAELSRFAEKTFGGNMAPETSVMDVIGGLTDRIAALEKLVAPRKPGRPKGS